MAPATVHLPNGQNLTVTPVFGGLYFKVIELSNHHSGHFPPGWTVVLNSEDEEDVFAPFAEPPKNSDHSSDSNDSDAPVIIKPTRKQVVHRFKQPTLQNDHLYISSISNPNSNDFRPASSPTRQIAMMLWATLWWYFHQQEPDRHITTAASEKTPVEGRPRGEWRININREGIFKSKVVLPKLERMGLVTSEDSSVGPPMDDRSGEGWQQMFVSRRSFWQLDARIYLFTLSPTAQSPYPSASPYPSRPGSPTREGQGNGRDNAPEGGSMASAMSQAMTGLYSPTTPGPFKSGSHLPTYYPPPPPQYTITNGIRHPIRPKPPRQGETFYTRYVPSVGQYISFRVASLSQTPPTYRGPIAKSNSQVALAAAATGLRSPGFPPSGESGPPSPLLNSNNTGMNDLDYLHKWMNDPRVAHSWGETGPASHQEKFLQNNLKSRHSFPVIGCWDGKPFGYFEIYWVKEDVLGRHLGGVVDNFDRGIHCLVGEQEFRGPQRARIWLSALVHWCWLADNRTDCVMMEPRVDNEKLLRYCVDVGFYKEREIAFPHKQSNLLKIQRDGWMAPVL